MHQLCGLRSAIEFDVRPCRWSKCSWFATPPADCALQRSLNERTHNNSAELAHAGTAKVGGAAAQNRFAGRTAVPIATTAARSSSTAVRAVETTYEPNAREHSGQDSHNSRRVAGGLQAFGGAIAHSRFNDRKRPCGQRCDGAPPPATRGPSRWTFDWERGAWHNGNAPVATAKHELAARRWGDGRDALAADQRTYTVTHPACGVRAKVRRIDPSDAPVGFASVVGAEAAKAELQRLVVQPLRWPAVLRAVGVRRTPSVLLHGLPGSGKTFLARAVAEEANAELVVVNGAEIVAGADAEAALRKAVERAVRCAPAVLFIDEADACAPTRAGCTSKVALQSTARVLAAVDRLRASGAPVALIAATSNRGALEPALCRAGRLDREICVAAPNAAERAALLAAGAAGAPLAADVDFAALAAAAPGLTPADCAAVVTEAVLRAVSDALARGEDLDTKEASPAAGVLVTRAHFAAAAAAVRPSALRALAPEVPTLAWDDIAGLGAAKRVLRELIEWPLERADTLRAYGVPVSSGALLYGPPGCGKTLLARAAAAHAGVNFLAVSGPELLDKWLGGSEARVREVFAAARAAAPCVVFFDEIDALAPRRGGGGADASGAAARVLDQLLVELDGVASRGAVFVLAATNRPEALDPALLRPGRIDSVCKVGLPDAEARSAMLAALFAKAPMATGVDVQSLVAPTAGMTGADVAHLARVALSRLVRREIAGVATGVRLTADDLRAALAGARRSVSDAEVERFDEMEAALQRGSLPAARPAAESAAARTEAAVTRLLQGQLKAKVGRLEGLLRVAAGVMRAQADAAGVSGETAHGDAWREVMAEAAALQARDGVDAAAGDVDAELTRSA